MSVGESSPSPAAAAPDTGTDAQIPASEAAQHVALIALELQLAFLIAVTYRCGPFQAVMALLLGFAVIPYVMVPVEAFFIGVPALVTLLLLRKRERTGRRRIWRWVQVAGVGILLAVVAFATVSMLFRRDYTWCEFG